MHGSQRFKCRDCVCVYMPDPLPLGYADEFKREALRLYLDYTDYYEIQECKCTQ